MVFWLMVQIGGENKRLIQSLDAYVGHKSDVYFWPRLLHLLPVTTTVLKSMLVGWWSEPSDPILNSSLRISRTSLARKWSRPGRVVYTAQARQC
jgi:hypothetical protein